jgi:hypothetical protein
MISVTAAHGPLVVKVSVTVPEVIEGVYVDDKLDEFEKLPDGAVQLLDVALPPIIPAKVIVPPAQTD